MIYNGKFVTHVQVTCLQKKIEHVRIRCLILRFFVFQAWSLSRSFRDERIVCRRELTPQSFRVSHCGLRIEFIEQGTFHFFLQAPQMKVFLDGKLAALSEKHLEKYET